MISDVYIKQFYNEITLKLGENYKLILEPGKNLKENWIEYDSVRWLIDGMIKDKVNKLLSDEALTLEEKILDLYVEICSKYIYDANVLYFFKRDDTNPDDIKYIAVDWYGRIVNEEWFINRQKHNRRICYEFSRFYAKAINMFIGERNDVEAVILGDKDNTHYVVGLVGKKYSIILDQDDFSSIKDLTRYKLGLSLKGIHILRDEDNIFTEIVNRYNYNKNENLEVIEQAKKEIKPQNFIDYINFTVNVLNKYNIDSQGFFEYIRTLIENEKIDIVKIWKIDTRSTIERRHERCLIFEYEGKTYLLDSVDKTLNCVDINELDRELFIFNPENNEYLYFGS